jgi:hypothetical protein
MAHDKLILNFKTNKDCFMGIITKLDYSQDPIHTNKLMHKITVGKKVDLITPDKDVDSWLFGIEGFMPLKYTDEYEEYKKECNKEIIVECMDEELQIIPPPLLSRTCTVYIVSRGDNAFMEGTKEFSILSKMKKEIENYKKAIETQKRMVDQLTIDLPTYVNEQLTDLQKNNMIKSLMDMKKQLSVVEEPNDNRTQSIDDGFSNNNTKLINK